jgi:hypothetical protein
MIVEHPNSTTPPSTSLVGVFIAFPSRRPVSRGSSTAIVSTGTDGSKPFEATVTGPPLKRRTGSSALRTVVSGRRRLS